MHYMCITCVLYMYLPHMYNRCSTTGHVIRVDPLEWEYWVDKWLKCPSCYDIPGQWQVSAHSYSTPCHYNYFIDIQRSWVKVIWGQKSSSALDVICWNLSSWPNWLNYAHIKQNCKKSLKRKMLATLFHYKINTNKWH